MRTLVCGGRRYGRTQELFDYLDEINFDRPITVVIHGGAAGADFLADEWARSRGIAREVYYADWQAHGRSAGPIRNGRMLSEGRPDIVVAFPGGPGTADMVKRAVRAGVRVLAYMSRSPFLTRD